MADTLARQVKAAVLARVIAAINGSGNSGISLATTGRTFAARPPEPPKRAPHIYVSSSRLRSSVMDGYRSGLRKRALPVLLEVWIPTTGDPEAQHATAVDLLQEIVDALESPAWILSLEAITGLEDPAIASSEGELNPAGAWAAAGRALVSVLVTVTWDYLPA